MAPCAEPPTALISFHRVIPDSLNRGHGEVCWGRLTRDPNTRRKAGNSPSSGRQGLRNLAKPALALSPLQYERALREPASHLGSRSGVGVVWYINHG